MPGEFRGQRSLAGYSAWDGEESDTVDAFLEHSRNTSLKAHVVTLNGRQIKPALEESDVNSQK